MVVLITAIAMAMPATGQTLEITLIDSDSGSPLADAVVLLPQTKAAEGSETLEVIQRHRAFDPHVLVAPVGSRVAFPNKDNTYHHVYSFSAPKTFELELYAQEHEKPVHFDRPGIVELGCNIHDQMQGFIIVADTKHLGQSAEDGKVRFTAAELDANTYPLTVRVWHTRMRDPSTYQEVSLPGPGSHAIELDLRPAKSGGRFDSLQDRFSG
ncbi:MAG: methylamine utilization protein [Halomonadaceae bacterium]|nr:MAG: methylamine utilization protein [Halomonadaceae bacterium]